MSVCMNVVSIVVPVVDMYPCKRMIRMTVKYYVVHLYLHLRKLLKPYVQDFSIVKLLQDALGDEHRSGLKTDLVKDWEKRSDMILSDKVPQVRVTASIPPCQHLGFCVCSGTGKVSQLFTKSFVKFMKSMFSLPRKPRKGPDGKPPEPVIETPETKRRRLNRKLLEAGMIVVKISLHHQQQSHDISDFNAFGEGWAEFALNALGQTLEVPNIPEKVLWFYIGYVNFQDWSMTFLPLTAEGKVNDLQKLVVSTLFARPAQITFAKTLGEEGFLQEWSAQFYMIHCEDRKLYQQETMPNWVLVKELPASDGENLRFRFWKGSDSELKAEHETKKRTRQQQQRKQTRKPKAPGFQCRGRRLKVIKRVLKHSIKDAVQDPEDSVGQNSAIAEEDVVEQHLDDLAVMQENNASPDPSESGDIEIPDFEGLVAESGMVDLPEPASSSTDAFRAATSEPVVVEPGANSSQLASSESKSLDEQPVPRVVISRRAPDGPDPSVRVTHTGEIRFNALSNRLIAVCKHPGHGDCRRSRTTQAAVRGAVRFRGQGRPLGLLTHFLLSADQYPDGPSHRKTLVESIPLEERKSARAHFVALADSEVMSSKEREKQADEDDEPDFIM